MNYKITVIITTYNACSSLQKSIDSILNQTFRNWFLILIDDGSTDNTNKIILKYKKKLGKRILILKNETNLGISSSLNKAIRHVKTPFFTRQDADDVSSLDRLERLHSFLEKNTNYDFVSSKMVSLNNKQITFPKKLIIKPTIHDFIYSLPFCNAPTLFRSNILKRVDSFDNSLNFKKRFEDYEFFFRCYLNNFKGINLDIVTYLVNQNKDYHLKISFSDRLFESMFKYKILKKIKAKWYLFYVIVIPIIKYVISLLLRFNKLIFFKSEKKST